jgi:DNA polymerase II large subunit
MVLRVFSVVYARCFAPEGFFDTPPLSGNCRETAYPVGDIDG